MKILFTIASIFIFSISFALNHTYTNDQYRLDLMPDSTFVFDEVSSLTFSIISGEYQQRNDSIILTTHRSGDETAIFAILKFSHNNSIDIEYLQKEYLEHFPSQLFFSESYFPSGNIQTERYYDGKMTSGNFEEYHWNDDMTCHSFEKYSKWNKIEEQIYFKNDKSGIPFPKEIRKWKNGLPHGKWYYYTNTESGDAIKFVKIEVYKKGKLKKEKW